MAENAKERSFEDEESDDNLDEKHLLVEGKPYQKTPFSIRLLC
jgi:hypothetical protein